MTQPAATASSDALRETAAFVRLGEIGLVTLTGPDALSFLQSLASQDLDGLAVGETRHSLLLEPQGKLTADFRVVRVGADDLWLVCEAPVASILSAALARFKIRVKVEIADASANVGAIAVRGPDGAAVVARNAASDGVVLVADPWPGLDGFLWVGPPAALAAIALDDLPEAGTDELEALRIELGVPRQPDDIGAGTIPQEAGLELTAVSFTKGCFLGQELVCRIDTRGHVNRTLRRLRATQPVAVGAEVVAGGKVVGTVSSAAMSPREGAVALATLRREVEPGHTVDIAGTPATVW